MKFRSFLFLFLAVLTGFTTLAQQKELSVSDLNNRKLFSKSLSNLQWIGKTAAYSWVAANALIRMEASKGKQGKGDTLVRLDDLNKALTEKEAPAMKSFPSVDWKSADIFTFTHNHALWQYQWKVGALSRLNQWNEKAENTDIQEVTGNLAFTQENNLFLAVDGNEIQVTRDSDPGIVNGSERVHRNEWGIDKGTFWSPAGSKLAFYRMDETMVADYPLVDIEPRIAKVQNSKYPMAGETSHQVTLGVYDLKTASLIFLKTGEPKDQFLTNICWSPDEKYIFIAVLNRAQDHMKLNQYDVVTGDFVRTLFEEKNERYVEPMNPMVFLKKNISLFLWESQRDGYNHLYLYDITGKLVRQLTKGEWVVTRYLGTDEDEKRVFFMGTRESPLESRLYSVEVNTGTISLLTATPGTHSSKVSAAGNYILDPFSSLTQPLEYQVLDGKGKYLYTLQQGENPLKEYKLGETTLGSLTNEEGITLYTRLIKPTDFDPKKKYPVVVYLYGGPHSQLITNSWLGGAGLYLNYLATQGYVVFTIDNRGSSNRGFAFESCIHRHLGDLEVKDQMTGVKYLKSLPFVDSTRMGVEGWSYGGFMTISMMLKRPGTFKVGICGGPVIDWKYYEVMYGERYMDTPQENPEGYRQASLLNYAGQLKGKLLVIHGTMDPTVVWQNSLAFVRKCVEQGVDLDYFVYPGHEHGVGGKDRLHLYRKQIQYYKDFL